MKKFAHILMRESFIPEQHTAEFEAGITFCIYTVRNPQEARERVLELKQDGFGVIELCGAFKRDFVMELIELTEGEVGFGYSVNEPEQEELFARFFDRK